MAIEDSLHPLLGLYFSAPDWLRASLGKAYSLVPVALSRGPRYKTFLAEAGLRDAERVRDLSRRKLAETLRHALASVPAYRSFRHLEKQLDRPEEVLRRLPFIAKEDVKRDLSAYLSTAVPARHRLHTATGGSTATPMAFYLHKGVTRIREYAYMPLECAAPMPQTAISR